MSKAVLEAIVRIFTLLMCVGATIAGSVALARILHIDGIVIAPGITLSYVIDLFNSPDIHTKTEATAALAVVSFAPIILILPLSIVTNILHLMNNNLGTLRKILVIYDLLLIFVAFCGYGAAGMLGGMTATHWTDVLVPYWSAAGPALEPFFGLIIDMKMCIVATAVCSLLASGSCIVLFVSVISGLVNKKRDGYTKIEVNNS